MIDKHRANMLTLAALAGLSTALAPGCGGSSRAYTPDATSARQALDATLAAWQKGEKPDRLATAAPPVHPVDFQWQAGQMLDGYKILDEQPGEDGATKRFSVTLTLKPPAKPAQKPAPAEIQARYVVFGREPVWVYREEDYARFLNMDNNPRPVPTRGGGRAGR